MSRKNSVWQLIEELNIQKGVTEIAINGPSKVFFLDKNNSFVQINAKLPYKDILDFIAEVCQHNEKICDKEHPILDGLLPDGSRINIVQTPLVHGFPAITIRRYVEKAGRFGEMKNPFGLDAMWITFLEAVVMSRQNIVISGGTGVGKTTFLNLLLQETSPAERIIIIEDTIEISLNRSNVVRLESGQMQGTGKGLSVRDLVCNTLRMRPDRIILGEVRGGEVFDLLQIMNTGHDGSMTTVHANSAGECFRRLETLYMLSGIDVPMEAIRGQISQAIDFVIQLGLDREGRRRVTEIQEITGLENNTLLSQVIASRNSNGKLAFKGIVPQRMQKLHQEGGIPLNFFNKS